MQTVETILKDLYGDERQAAERLGVVPTAVWNWKSWGYFPTRLLPQLLADASTANVQIELAEIPINPKDRAA